MKFDHDLGLIESLLTIDTTVASPTNGNANQLVINGTGSITIPVGTTVQQPPAARGQLRYDSSTDQLMWSNAATWNPISSGGGGSPAVWIRDVTPTTTGIVGFKTFRSFVANNPLIDTATSDTYNVRVHINGSGDSTTYSPSITVNSVSATITESTTAMWFNGYADIVLVEGPNVITATNGLDTDTVIITAATSGPAVQTVVFGAYPGTQTALKLNDTMTVTITTDISATSVVIQASGASKTQVTLPVTAGTATGSFAISSASGAQPITVIAYNSLGTAGAPFVSGTLNLDQVIPTFTLNSITYASGFPAANVSEHVFVDVTVNNFDTVTYSSPHVSIPNPTTYAQSKDTVVTLVGYNITNNYTIVANKAANNSTATFNTTIKIASVAPTAAISIQGNPTRLTSSVVGIDYEIRITPSQLLYSTPSLNASIGTWMGSWTLSSGVWIRNLRVMNSDSRGAGLFSALSLVNEANIAGSTITSGSAYTVGGFSPITVTFPAFSRVAAMGVAVADQTKTSAQIVGGNTLTLHTDNGEYANGYYIANSDGTYNQNGTYLGLSDSAFAGSNTSGTLQATIQEVA